MGGRDMELLERHAPLLRYDPQDAYRAVSAATMTDAPCNRLLAADGSAIAGGAGRAPLGLATLASYPPPHRFAEGDHLASGPSPLQDAVAMQARASEYPHCAYGRVVPRPGARWLQYWLWYHDNPKTFLGRGRHEGDWELVVVKLREGDLAPRAVTCSQHHAGEARAWERVEKVGERPVVYVAPFSHANYFQAGTRFYFPAADHPTDAGPRVPVEVAEFGEWRTWEGRWGSSKGILMGWRPLAALVRGRLGGASPDAPIRQRKRWLRPRLFHAEAVARKPLGGLKTLLWRVGKRTYPPAPRLRSATAAAGRIEVSFELDGAGARRPRHLLLTAHEAGGAEPVLISVVVRRAPRSGTATLRTPASSPAPGKLLVYASAFNALGQRSDLDRIAA